MIGHVVDGRGASSVSMECSRGGRERNRMRKRARKRVESPLQKDFFGPLLCQFLIQIEKSLP